MRFAYGASALLVLAACVLNASCVDDITVGDCDGNDLVIINRRIYKPPIPGISMKVTLAANARRNTYINCAQVRSLDPNSQPSVVWMKGGANEKYIVLLIQGPPGRGLHLQFTVHVKRDWGTGSTTETPEPTTPEPEPEPSTPEPTASEPEPEPSTPEPTTAEPEPEPSKPEPEPTTDDGDNPTEPIPTTVPGSTQQTSATMEPASTMETSATMEPASTVPDDDQVGDDVFDSVYSA